jgi:deoxyribose-phosphate aldolase
MKDLSQIVLEMLASLNSMQRQTTRLIDIAADGMIDDEELKDFFLLADKFNFGEITVSPDLVSRCIKPVKKYDLSHVKVSTIIGFPFGDDTFSGKIVSLKQCVSLGIDEASVAMKFKGGDKAELKLFKKQLKKINSCFSRRVGVALSAHDMEEKDLITAIKLIEKTDLNHVLLTFGECSFQDVKEKLEKVNKVKGKKAVKIMLNAKNPEDIKSVVELGANIVLTPYLDEIIKNLAKTLGVL